MHKLLILSKHRSEDYLRLLTAAHLPGLEIHTLSQPSEAAQNHTTCDLIFGEPPLIREVLPYMTGLRWVQATWAGVDQLVDPALRRDYTLTNARGVFGGLMSEFVFGYILLHERRILERYQAQQVGRWDNTTATTLHGKRLGLLGVGSIGAALAHTGVFFGMRVRGYTRSSESCPDIETFYHGGSLGEFADNLDYLVCTLPAAPGARQIVNRSLLERLPPRAFFINVGRGNAVDEQALDAALRSGRLAGAVLDVFEQEPLPPEHFFWHTPNLWITGHTAAPSYPEDLAGVFIDNYRRFLSGEALRYQVDFERGY